MPAAVRPLCLWTRSRRYWLACCRRLAGLGAPTRRLNLGQNAVTVANLLPAHVVAGQSAQTSARRHCNPAISHR